MAVNDAWAITLEYSKEGQKFTSTLHYLETAAIPPGLAPSLIGTNWWNATAAAWQDIASDDLRFECVYVRKVKGDPEHPFTNVLEGVVGAQSSPLMPPSTVAVFLVPATVGSSRNNNRIFWSGVAHVHSQGNTLTNAALTGEYQTLTDLLNQTFPILAGSIDLCTKISTIGGVPVVPPQYDIAMPGFWRAVFKNNRRRESKSTGVAA